MDAIQNRMTDEIEGLSAEIAKLLSTDDPVSLNYIVENTNATTRREAKTSLRELMRKGIITTTPGFGYRLSKNFTKPESWFDENE